MTLDGLITFVSIVVAIYAIPGQSQRRSMLMFVSWSLLVLPILLSAILLMWPGVLDILGYELLPWTDMLIKLLAFVLPVTALLSGILLWVRAKLNSRHDAKFSKFLMSCLRDNIYDEAERILRKNKDRLPSVLTPDTIKIIFDRKFVDRLCESRSWLHLDLLSNEKLLTVLHNRHAAVDAIIREMLLADESPLRSAVIHVFGGEEHHDYPNEQKTLINATLQNPKWYHDISAHYPLVISAMEQLNSGKLDSVYNINDQNYVAHQGVSSRTKCIVWVATKTHVLAIREAIKQNYNEDFYVSDLFEIFHMIRERSVHIPVIWEGDKTNFVYPTPFAYLLYQINLDLNTLSRDAVIIATGKNGDISEPNQIVLQIAQIWAFCTWDVSRSTNNVDEPFKLKLIADHLHFILQLGFGPSEIYGFPSPSQISGIDVWRDLYANQLKERFQNAEKDTQMVLQKAIDNLDTGKHYISQGKSWLDETFRQRLRRAE